MKCCIHTYIWFLVALQCGVLPMVACRCYTIAINNRRLFHIFHFISFHFICANELIALWGNRANAEFIEHSMPFGHLLAVAKHDCHCQFPFSPFRSHSVRVLMRRYKRNGDSFRPSKFYLFRRRHLPKFVDVSRTQHQIMIVVYIRVCNVSQRRNALMQSYSLYFF